MNESNGTTDLTRRDVLVLAGACACCAMAPGGADAAEPAQAGTKAKSVTIGTPADFPKPGFYDKFVKPNKVMVARLDDRLVAMTSVCTHKGCAVKIKPDGDEPALKCPCHKAEFGPQGTPVDGPAKVALARYAVTRAADGTVTVDLTRTFVESKWDEKDAFVSIKA